MKSSEKGFTLIELLVVVAIIGLLSSVIMTTIGGGRIKARDAKRMADLAEIKKALELYYADNYRYPSIGTGSTAYTSAVSGGVNWSTLETALTPYMTKLPIDPLGLQTNYRYYYDADSGDNYQTYGIMARLEHPDNYARGSNDNGWTAYATNGQYYEVGEQPSYCANTGTSENWYSTGANVCTSRN